LVSSVHFSDSPLVQPLAPIPHRPRSFSLTESNAPSPLFLFFFPPVFSFARRLSSPPPYELFFFPPSTPGPFPVFTAFGLLDPVFHRKTTRTSFPLLFPSRFFPHQQKVFQYIAQNLPFRFSPPILPSTPRKDGTESPPSPCFFPRPPPPPPL